MKAMYSPSPEAKKRLQELANDPQVEQRSHEGMVDWLKVVNSFKKGQIGNMTFERGDTVLAKNKQTSETREMEYVKPTDTSHALLNPEIGRIPYNYSSKDWDLTLVKKVDKTPPQYSLGDRFVDNTDGQEMKITKVSPGGRYVVAADGEMGIPVSASDLKQRFTKLTGQNPSTRSSATT
jgi:hypothetical protein